MATTNTQSTLEALQALAKQLSKDSSVPSAPSSEKYSGPAREDGATVPDADPLFTSTPEPTKPARIAKPLNPEAAQKIVSVPPSDPPVVIPEAPPVSEIGNFLFLTGQPASGVSQLIREINAVEISALESAEVIIAHLAGRRIQDAALIQKVIEYGNSSAVSVEALLFCKAVHDLESDYSQFGNPNFWTEYLIASARTLAEQTRKRIVLSGVNTLADFKQLQVEGFQHWHVMCSPATRARRLGKPITSDPGYASSFITALDNSVIRQTSNQPNGNRLHCIWNDESVPNKAARLWDVSSWVLSAATLSETAPEIEIQ